MKKILLLLLCLLPWTVQAKEPVTLYFFYGDGCPVCENEKAYLEELKQTYSNLEIVEYEVWNNPENQKLLDQVKEKLDSSARGVPYNVIGEIGISGFNEELKSSFEKWISYCSENTCKDILKETEIKEEKPSENIEKPERKKETTFLAVLGIVLCLLGIVWIIFSKEKNLDE